MKDRTYKFAQFELNLGEGELRANNSTVRLQGKPLLLLSALLDHPQRLVTREQLRDRMWDSRTIVDYEQGINVAIKKVRDALGDSAENPKYIETVARKGYRFLVPVTVVAKEVDAPPKTEPRAVATDKQTQPHRAFFLVIAVIVCAALGLGLSEFRTMPRHTAPIQSLAVLPLQDVSPDVGQEYFADGITEEVITNLAQTLPLRVISRTSVVQYKQTNKPITQIARELGVDYIVEGSVARSGNRVTVTVQLIDASTDRHLWAQKYDRGLEDILTVEAELSQAIASQVHSTLSAQQVKLAKRGPVDGKVYDLCLLGGYHLNKRTAEDLAKAQDYYQQAVARDPTYAPAYAGLASVYALSPHYGTASIEESAAKGAALAHRALELDDNLAEAHAILGFIGLSRLSEWASTEPEFRRALQIDPNDSTAHHWFAYYLFIFDRKEEALGEIALARQLDPLSAITNADQGHFLYAVRHFDEARVRLQQAIELAPELGQPHETLALVELETGHPADALKEARAGLALDPTSPSTMGEAGYVMAVTGETAQAQALLSALQERARNGSAFPVFVALLQIGLGQRDLAVDTMRDMIVSNARLGIGLGSLAQWHAFDELAGNTRYRALVALTAENHHSTWR
jgi:TolB-like protein/DNA-binding winged helix-turn-helix (wHTH) protein/Tfp pilus assembly protein PilF